VFVKRKQERIEHVWMKAFLWALYLPEHPDLLIRAQVGKVRSWQSWGPCVVYIRNRL
jgi:hypothetical protein